MCVACDTWGREGTEVGCCSDWLTLLLAGRRGLKMWRRDDVWGTGIVWKEKRPMQAFSGCLVCIDRNFAVADVKLDVALGMAWDEVQWWGHPIFGGRVTSGRRDL